METVLLVGGYVLGLGVLLLLSAFFSGSETALFSLTRTQARRLAEGSARDRRVTQLLSRPRRLLSTILIGNLLVNVCVASLVTSGSRRALGQGGVPVAILVTAILLLIFGEVTPKASAALQPLRFARLVAGPLMVFAYVVMPFRHVLREVSEVILRAMGLRMPVGFGDLTAEEIHAMLAVGAASGAATDGEQRIAGRILEMAEVTGREVMVPRTEVNGLRDELTLGAAFEQALTVRHSHLPVYQDDLDRVWGLLHTADLPRWRGHPALELPLASWRSEDRGIPVPRDDFEGIPCPLTPAVTAPESATLEKILAYLNETEAEVVLLLDEYGGTEGMLTMHDVQIELLGRWSPLHDEHERIETVDEGTWRLQGRVFLRELEDALGEEFEVEDADTVGGYVLSLLGRLPRAGDVATDGRFRYTVINMAGRRVGALLIERLPSTEPGGAA